MQDWSRDPYWLDGLPDLPRRSGNLPESTDVLVVGSGYTGLNAALETARAGRSTLVLDAGEPGRGCSTRNGGQVSPGIKPSLSALARKYGESKGRAIRDEGVAALDWIGERVKAEGIECGYRPCGRFHAAHSPKAREALVREAERLREEEGVPSEVVARGDQHAVLGTDLYHGGVVFPRHAALDPARYHRGLLGRAEEAGATVVGGCAVEAVERAGTGFEVRTSRGRVGARDVLVATNGYTGGATPRLRRRVVPIGSYIIATEPLPRKLMDRLFPEDRVVSDTRRVVYYFRPSPDRTRILFGGRVSANETDTAASGPLLHAEMCRVFPELRGCRISHSWMGTVAYTFDELPHTGVDGGVHYAMGYCGVGVALASYLGMRAGQRLLGLKEGATALDGLRFPTRPLYTGRPWFLPPVVAWYRWLDRARPA